MSQLHTLAAHTVWVAYTVHSDGSMTGRRIPRAARQSALRVELQMPTDAASEDPASLPGLHDQRHTASGRWAAGGPTQRAPLGA
jgi:hypothetical protein